MFSWVDRRAAAIEQAVRLAGDLGGIDASLVNEGVVPLPHLHGKHRRVGVAHGHTAQVVQVQIVSTEETGIEREYQTILLSASAPGNGTTTISKPSSLSTNSRRQTVLQAGHFQGIAKSL